MNQGDHYIGGAWVSGHGDPMKSTDPATDQATWEGLSATREQVQAAVQAGRDAFNRWASTTLVQRIEAVRSFGQQLQDHKEALAMTVSRDIGKPLWESRTELGAMIGKIELSIQAYQERCNRVEKDLNGVAAVTRFKPHGVCAVYGPFNLPGHLPNGHIVPALIAGNTVVFKPSELAAAVGHHMIQLWEAVGLPAGVLNMVQGGRETGVALAQQSDIDGLFFTGSYATGVALSRGFADRPEKMLALEMGGNNPLVVWQVSDLNAAAYLAVQSAFITAGQRCTCARRLIVPDNDEGQTLLDRLADLTRSLRVGVYTDQPEPFIGPVINSATADRMLDAQSELLGSGGKAIVDMTRSSRCSALLSPGIVDVTEVVNRTDEEWFGPLLQVIRVSSFDQAIDEANSTQYGLSAALFSDDRTLYEQFSQRVRAGVVNWNRQTTGASGTMPFGGVGGSGNHRPAGYWAVDYCCYPVASMELDKLSMPPQTTPGISP